MIAFRNFALRRGERLLLSGVDLALHGGWRVGVVGRNGTGKSSLFAAIRGELEPDRGDIELPGRVRIASVAQETPALPGPALDFVLGGDAEISLALRAAADNPTAATYMGIDVDRAHRIAFALGSGITAVAGGLVASYLSFTPFMGLDFVVIMYAGVVLGGMGSLLGAFWGGLTIGFVQQISALVLPPQLQNAAIFVVFLLIVVLRPQGLFGRSAERA